MGQDHPTLEDVVKLATQLSLSDKRRLIEHIEAEMIRDASVEGGPTRSLRGLWADLGPAPSAEEIDEARREAWKNFPREDI